ncbi:Helicase required for RNAi-mediated heterochromatin assembly 1 [Cytospora mali]|uniref:Helicase required for RNAi-mediated heterochromatin assembly 1 n=1 Tax=Cytospora mali TaxID=578113 RepID=A0A194UY26_CYTMA|nr:Helicase required for RNAi-mediated heterochromatin assembly 1 [Valsa mali var. pyri (nom. inval.)]
MDGDLGASQETIRLLATDPGLNFIKAITDRHVPEATSGQEKVYLWRAQVSLLFRLITHPRAVDSNILEQQVATVYSFILGINASRMDKLFSFVADLAGACTDDSGSDIPQMTVLESSLAVLSKLVDSSTSNIINNSFHHIVERFDDLVNSSKQPHDDFFRLQATKYLDYLQRRLGIGRKMAEAKGPERTNVQRESFVIDRDLPGRLSKDGPRHDNDHADISKIRIMPTYQEITTSRSEYLPTNDSSQWHLPGVRGRLDREFRLLREDTVGQLRDAVGDLLERIRNPGRKEYRQSQNSARTTTYEDAIVQTVGLDKDKGLELTVRCRQPDIVQKMGDRERRLWWDQCKRLQPGALVCVLDAAGMVQFFVVADSTLRVSKVAENRSDAKDNPQSQAKQEFTLSSDKHHLHVKLNLVSTSRLDIVHILRWYRDIGSSPRRFLVEFPGILLASFKYTLEALQQLSKKPDLPFSGLIAPETPTTGTELTISPPLFSRAAGFAFDMKCLTLDEQELSASIGHLPTAKDVSEKTGLDDTQSEALLSTLCRELSLIQGPPGTGKSYTGEKIIKVLLSNKKKANLGPIMCVCYTNHALDQLLEHLLDDGIKDIIRIGSRSKSERLQDFTLWTVADQIDWTRSEKRELYELGQKLRNSEAEANRLLAQLSQCNSMASIKTHLYAYHRAHHDELFSKDANGWQEIQHRSHNVVQGWLSGGDANPRLASRGIDVLKSTKLANMTRAERSSLYRDWLKSIRDPLIIAIIDVQREHSQTKEQRDRVRQEVRRRCLQQADIVGVTTTGLARELSLLRKLRTKVILCEEAGEVLEAHILTTLLPSIEQAIFIGDHLQLRPQIQNYQLQSTNPRGSQYSLDMSLFERLVKPPHSSDPRLPVSVLETQRRMHPSIAEMVRSTLYKTLKDGENVKTYPPVVGMRHRLFWMHHEELEAGAAAQDPHNTSHSNAFEIEMTAALISHVVRQGKYNPEDIAVLTPYLGQLQKLKARMAAESTFAVSLGERDLEDLEEFEASEPDKTALPEKQVVSKTTLLRSVRLATVDNFQGEEAKVVIISLVRSNPQNRCGFLSTSNRINVLMSRAKHGCYIIGNAKTYSNVPMWTQIIRMLQVNGNFGTKLELQCPRHPDTRISVSQPDHFICGSEDVRSTVVDFYEMMEYKDINIDETPCIFPDCGHFFTVESMDGQMDMGEHYELDERGLPVGIKPASKPFSMDEVKACSTCRGSLRNVSRYGRMVRRAMLDEATKKFISWFTDRHLELAERLLVEEQKLEHDATITISDIGRPGRLDLTGSAYNQVKNLRKWVGQKRYSKLEQTYIGICKYMEQVSVVEQPFHKVREFVQHANRNHKTQGAFVYDEEVIQLRGYLLAISLLLKCNVALLSDFLSLWRGAGMRRTEINVDFSANLGQCEELIKLAADTSRPQLQVEGHTYYAQFCGFAISLGTSRQPNTASTDATPETETVTPAAAPDPSLRERLQNKGFQHLEQARSLLENANWGSKQLMEAEIEAARQLLNGGVFYKPVTNDELRAVYAAMASEFRGTGHWYTCEQGHPFTVGECGMPMEQARCPECGSPVGGQNHDPAEGVRRANAMEELAAGLGGVRI